MKIRFSILIILFFFSINHVKAITFNNYYDLNECVDYYNSFKNYKTNLQNCFKNQNIILEENSLKAINNRSGIIEDIIQLDLPKEQVIKNKKRKRKLSEVLEEIFSEKNIEKIAEEENIFNKPSVFSDNYNKEKKFSLDNKNFRELNNYIKKNPEDIYALTEDINILTYKNKYLSEFKRKEILLNIYNSFNSDLLISKANLSIANASTPNMGAAALIGVLAVAGGGGGGGSSSTPATISFSVSSASVAECDNAITITGSLTKAHSSNVTITYSTSGTATDGTDYNLSSTTSTIVAGATSGSITLTPVNDTTNETSETAIVSASVSGVSTTGNTSTTITIHDYVLECNTTAYSEDTSVQSAITGRSSWATVDQSTNIVHPYELVNLHKAHSFKNSSSQYLTGKGETIYISDSALNNNHDSFSGKTVTMLDTPSTSSTTHDHGTHVSSIAAGVIGGTTHGVAPEASIVFSSSGDGAADKATDLDTARTSHSAIVGNHSWGYCDITSGSTCISTKTMTELESSASSAGRNVREELAASYWGGTSPTSTYITALDNFQNSGVIVFALGNVSGDSDASFMAALPYYFNGTDDSVDLSDAWLAVMYSEFTGSSLSSASTSDFNRLGNPCGKAKEWCLVVDDLQIGAAGYVNGSGTSVYSTLGGSSMGAPQVSGMVALLGQAFPNHTPEQLTDRLLASANNSWFTSSGNTTFTTHGASVKHGYNDTWGHGVPDMYAALSPISTNSNPFSFGSGGGGSGGGGGSSGGESVPFSKLTKHAVSLTSFSTSSSLGDAIYSGLENKTVYAYDALNGGFKLNISDFINYKNLEEQNIEISLEEELNYLRIFNDKTDNSVREMDFKNFNGEFINFRDKYNQGLSITLDQPNIALQNFNLNNNNFYKNPFISENKGVGFNNKFYFLGNDILIGYNNSKVNPLTNINKDLVVPIETLAMSINIDNNNFDLLSFTTGLMKEENTFLLSETEGAFNMNNDGNLSNFYGLNLSKKLNNFGNLNISTMIGNSKTSNNISSIIVDNSNVISSSFEINYELKNIFKKDQLEISLSQPNKIEHGDMTFRLMGLADKNGILPYKDHKIDLKPSGRQKDLSISYYKNHSNNFKTGFKTIITDDMGHVKNSNLNSNFMLTTSLTF